MTPKEIMEFKPKGTEIHQKNGHYYVYRVVGYYDPASKKTKTKSKGCIGQIYADIGFVPNGKKGNAIELITKEYGATRTVMALNEELYTHLRTCFPSDFIRLYVMAVLKLLGNLTLKDIGTAYEKSAISLMLPEVHLSRNTVSDFLISLSRQRQNMIRFMREFTDCTGDNVIFDGSSFYCESRSNPYCGKGYSPGHKGNSQVRLMYAFNKNKKQPVFFKVAPGYISDKMAFEAAVEESGCRNCTVILDKGFFSDRNIKLITGSDLEFIIPCAKNTTLVDNSLKKFSAYERFLGSAFTYHKRVIFYTTLNCAKYPDCSVSVFYDNERHQNLVENYILKHQDEDGNLPTEIQQSMPEETSDFGVTILLSNKDSDSQQVYLDYKTRWSIEEMFDTHKNTLCFDMKSETRQDILEGWAFVEFLSLQMYYSIDRKLCDTRLTKSLSVKDLLFKTSAITQSKASGKWQICNMTNKISELFKTLGISLANLN